MAASLFALPGAGVSYLNGSAKTPLPRCVYDVGVSAVGEKLEPWLDQESLEQPGDLVRSRFLELVAPAVSSGSCCRANVALTPSTSFAMSGVALNLAREATSSTRVVVLEDQMSSNVLPWQNMTGAKMEVVPFPAEEGDWTASLLKVIASLPRRSKSVVAVPHCHWVDGSKLNLSTVSKACRDADFSLVVDATQSIGAMPLDVDGPLPRLDFLCASAHKWLLGPHGLSPLFVSDERAQHLLPLVHDEHALQGADDTTSLPFSIERGGYDHTNLKPKARPLDAGGRPNPIILPMVAEGLRFLLEDLGGPHAIAQHTEALSAKAASLLREAPWATLKYPRHRAPHILGLRGGTHFNAETWAADLKKHHNVHLTGRFGALRVSFHVYNDIKDVHRLVDSLEAVSTSFLSTT